MRVCILSMQKVNNYGSVLQAYSLKKIIESLGHEVEFIDIQPGLNKILNDQCMKLAPHSKENEKNWFEYQLNRIDSKIHGRRRRKMLDEFRLRELGIPKDITLRKKYDFCVIGSDEVFNCLQKSKWGFDPQLFGKVDCADTVITYAASCGATKEEMLSEDLKNAIVEAMKKLSFISVRDDNTSVFVKKLTKREPILNLDPVAVGNFDYEISTQSIDNKIPCRYGILYSYKDRFSDSAEISEIKRYCKEKNIELIAPYGRQKWIKRCKELSPFELLKAYQNAEFIITDTFHGTLFGARFAKRMAIVVRDSNRNKLADLTKRLQIDNHVLYRVEDLNEVLNLELDRENIDSILLRERERTFKYLETAFSARSL